MNDNRNLGELLGDLAIKLPHKDAIVFEGQRFTYEQFEKHSVECSKLLVSVGVAKGSRVGILLPNRPEWLFWAFGAMKLGAIVVPISTWSKEIELKYILRHSDVSVLVTSKEFKNNSFIDLLYKISPEIRESKNFVFSSALPSLRKIISTSDEQHHGIISVSELRLQCTGVPDNLVRESCKEVRPNDVALILYTSGSTSTPKAVQLTHFGMLNNAFNIGERQHLNENDKLWLVVPLFWIYGCGNALLAAMTHGSTVVLQEYFEAGRALELIEKEGCTVYYGMPNITTSLLQHPNFSKNAVSSLKKGVTIGRPEIIKKTIHDLGVTHLCNIYGQTETYGNCCVTDSADSLEVRMYSHGKPLPNTTIKIISRETKEEMPIGSSGEIYVKNYDTPGYYKMNSSQAKSSDPDGFFKTGDEGFLDNEGYLHFLGRMDEIIKTSGINVSPAEVEAVLLTHSQVRLAFVFGIPDPIKDECVGAVIVCSDGDGNNCSAEEIISFCRGRIASYKVPRYVELRNMEDIPFTATGKVARLALRQDVVSKMATTG